MTVVCGTVGFLAVVFRDVKPILAPQTLQTFFSNVAIKIAALPEMEKREDRQGEALKGKAAKPYRAVVDTNGSESLAVGCFRIGM